MRISTGLSELTFVDRSRETALVEKIYLWPIYAERKIERVSRITRESQGVVYYKPLPEERDRLLSIVENTNLTRYTAKGTVRGVSSVLPGMFFEAVV
ncbi:MAG: hypothetical protein N2316_12955 [Spirochaetes bacterium]|nr:hypothetical protein [Spirochaetota bacterium]